MSCQFVVWSGLVGLFTGRKYEDTIMGAEISDSLPIGKLCPKIRTNKAYI